MIRRVVDFALSNRLLVLAFALMLFKLGYCCVPRSSH